MGGDHFSDNGVYHYTSRLTAGTGGNLNKRSAKSYTNDVKLLLAISGSNFRLLIKID